MVTSKKYGTGKSTAPKSRTATAKSVAASRRNAVKASVSRVGSRNPYYRIKSRGG